MENFVYENIENTCRLCLKPDGIKLLIFGDVGVQRDVAYKINICFSLAIYETDPLSKLICHRCLYRLEQIYEFRSEVLIAFQQLKKAMSMRRSDPIIDKYLSMVEDEIIIIGRSETCHPDNKPAFELTDETVDNNPAEPSDECITFSGHSPGDQDELIEIIKHEAPAVDVEAPAVDVEAPAVDVEAPAVDVEAPAVDVEAPAVDVEAPAVDVEAPAVDVHDAALEVQPGNSSSEGNNLFSHVKNETTCISSELNNQAYCDNRIESDKQEVVPYGLVRPENVLETLCRPQPGGKPKKKQKQCGLKKKQAASIAENVDLQWCNFCQKYLKTKKIFKQHNVKVHNAERSPTCECKCKRKFRSVFEMLTHQQTHLKVNIKITEDMLLKCNLCDKKFADHSILKMHLTTHSDKFNGKCLFKSSTDELDIVRKFKIGHKDKRIINMTAPPSELFVCDHCWQIFETASSLSQHINSKHCFILCNCISGEKNVSTNNNVHQIKEIDNLDQPSDNTVSVTSLKSSTDHNQSSFASLVNQCTLCDKVFSSKKSLKKHNKKHFPSKATGLLCTFCDKTFEKRSRLVSHLRKHFGDESYHCKYCTKTYSNKEIFLSHKCLSNKVYPFCNLQLPDCAVEFASQIHQNSKGHLSLLDHNDHPKTRQINVSGSNQEGSLEQSEEPEKEYIQHVQFPKKRKKYNQSKKRKHIKKSKSEYSRTSHISRNENCVKCPFCHHFVKPESMFQHIYENHPDSNNIT